ncbi:hypothetical protein Veis_1527 [Verminephrobacter eiseniae EF01-2]|uniref:Uncharacterized protein n=1 Tax=Verminephrobacter eiseniae (strain EF01-2) TaxID=391735 RepID=A1WI29_VEREI|nr:hypothetical protein Veis_1527 [Verminephrobacter eiseniae EF01-2]
MTFLTTGNEFCGQQYSAGAAHRDCHDERSGRHWKRPHWAGAAQMQPSVASPIICRSALAIEAQRGVASLANTARYGLRDAPCAALRWLRAAYDI